MFCVLEAVSYFTSKMNEFRNSRKLQFRTSMLWQKPQASPANKGEERYFIEKKEEVRYGCFEGKSYGGKLEFRV